MYWLLQKSYKYFGMCSEIVTIYDTLNTLYSNVWEGIWKYVQMHLEKGGSLLLGSVYNLFFFTFWYFKIEVILIIYIYGLPWWLSVKESTCNAGDADSIPGSGRSPGGGLGNPLQYSCLGNPMGRGAWWATIHGVRRMYIGQYQQQMFVKARALELETGSVWYKERWPFHYSGLPIVTGSPKINYLL